MTKRRFTPWVALACIGTLAACTSGEGGTPAGNTELNVMVPTTDVDIQTIEYTITCLGNDDTFLDNNASFTDQVRIDGNLEVVDGRTSFGAGSACNGGDNNGATCYPNRCTGGDNPGAPCNTVAAPSLECQGTAPVQDGSCDPSPNSTECPGTAPVQDGRCETVADFGASPGNQPLPNNQSEIWQGFEDLPPGPCNMQMRARDNDGEVICTTDEGFFVTADATIKVNLILMCKSSFQAPVGSADFDATFSFNVGNFCPDQFVLNCTDSNPDPAPLLPPPNPEIAATTCEVRFRDGDSTCGNNCDPQECTPSAQGLTCKPGPDPGVSTTITCTAGTVPETGLLDCEGDGAPDASCTIKGDTLGVLPEFFDGVIPGTPIACASAADCEKAVPGLPGIECVDNECDFSNTNPRLNTSFVVACAPPGPPFFGTPGVTVTCTAVTTDGDNDCDKTKTVQVECPGLSPCTTFGGDAACQAAAGTVCVSSTCNEGTCDGLTATACCDDANAPDGTDCSAEQPPLASCTGGVCGSDSCSSDIQCDDGNDCTANTCNVGTGLCESTLVAGGTSCNGGAGACDGAGACVDNCSGADCSDGNDCTQDVCTSVGGPTCSNPFEPNGTACDAGGGNTGACDGAGACVFIPTVDPPPVSLVMTTGCSNNVTGDVSILDFNMDVDAGTLGPGLVFSADLDGTAAFVETFLDAAQAVVPGGVRSAQVIDVAASIAVRSGATGPDVELGADFSVLDNRCTLTGASCTGVTDPPSGGDCLQIPSVVNNCAQGFADVPVTEGIPLSAGGCTQPALGTPVPDCDCAGCENQDPVGCRPGDPDVPCTKGDQCNTNGFCVAGDLKLELTANKGNYTAGASGDTILFGWYDGLTPPVAPGLLSLPAAVFATPPSPLGVRVSAGGLFVALQCLMAVDSGGANGITVCVGGSNNGVACANPSDNSNNVCVGSDDNGLNCSQESATACTSGSLGECVNNDCGAGATCEVANLAATTADGLLIPITIP